MIWQVVKVALNYEGDKPRSGLCDHRSKEASPTAFGIYQSKTIRRKPSGRDFDSSKAKSDHHHTPTYHRHQ